MRTLRIGISMRGSNQAFTLIELLIVMTILGVFAGIMSLRVEGIFTGGDLSLAARRIIGAITEHRGEAAYRQQERVLCFNMDQHAFYSLKRQEKGDETIFFSKQDENKEIIGKIDLPSGVYFEDVVIPSKGKVQEGEAYMTFFKNGCVDGSLIHLRNEADESYTLEVNPITGQVKVHDGYIEKETQF